MAMRSIFLFLVVPLLHPGDPIAGSYSSSIGGYGHVQTCSGGYLFTDEVGTTQLFMVTGRNQLRSRGGSWNRNIIVTVGRDNFGRTVLRFDAPGSRCIYWVRLC